MPTVARLCCKGSALQERPPSAVTIFASPMPPRVGDIDLSVLVRSSDALEPVLDADVHLEFMKSGSWMQVQATRQAQKSCSILPQFI